MNIINKIEQEQLKADVTAFNVGDTIKVHTRVIEGGKERIQIFQGIVIAKRGSGVNEALRCARFPTVRAWNACSPCTPPASPRLKS